MPLITVPALALSALVLVQLLPGSPDYWVVSALSVLIIFICGLSAYLS